MAMIMLLSGCAAPQKAACPLEPIPIGVVYIGAQESPQKAGYQKALEEINRAGKGCPLQLVFPPPESVNDPQAAMLSLADQGTVAILGASSDETAKRIAAISDYIATPVLITAESADDILATGSKQVFRIDPPYQAYADSAFKMVADTLFRGSTTVAFLYEDSEYAQSAAVTAATSALDRGFRIASYEFYAPLEGDIVKLLDVTQQNADAYLKGSGGSTAINIYYVISTHPEDARRILAEINARKTNPVYIIGSGRGFTNLDFKDEKNPVPALNRLVLVVPWSENLGKKAGSSETFPLNLDYLAALPQVEARLSMALVGHQIQRLAVDADQFKPENLAKFRANLADALRSLTGGPNDPSLAQIAFEETGGNQLAPVLVQVVNGQVVRLGSK